MFYDIYCQLCRKQGLTPSGAAAQIGFNRASVTVWKNTGKAPKQELLLKIAAFFGVTTDYLLTGRAAPQVPLEQPQLDGDEDHQEDPHQQGHHPQHGQAEDEVVAGQEDGQELDEDGNFP